MVVLYLAWIALCVAAGAAVTLVVIRLGRPAALKRPFGRREPWRNSRLEQHLRISRTPPSAAVGAQPVGERGTQAQWFSGTPGIGLVSFGDAARIADSTLPGWREELVPWPQVLLRGVSEMREATTEDAPPYAVFRLDSPTAEKVFERLASPLDQYALEAAIGQRLLTSLPAGADGPIGYQDSWLVVVPRVRDEAELRSLGERILQAFTRPLDPEAALLRFFAHGGQKWMPTPYGERPLAEVLSELEVAPLVCPVRLGAALADAPDNYYETQRRAFKAHARIDAAPGFDLEPLSEQRRHLWRGNYGFRNRFGALAAAVAAALEDADTAILVCDGGPRLDEAEPAVRFWVLMQAYRPALRSVLSDDCLFELPGDVFVAVLPGLQRTEAHERGAQLAALICETECSVPDPDLNDVHDGPWLPVDERFLPRICIESAPRGSDPRALLETTLRQHYTRQRAPVGPSRR